MGEVVLPARQVPGAQFGHNGAERGTNQRLMWSIAIRHGTARHCGGGSGGICVCVYGGGSGGGGGGSMCMLLLWWWYVCVMCDDVMM